LFKDYVLTGKLNDSVKLSKINKEPISILYLDLDGFKAINDTYGHDTGDEVLKRFAKIIMNNYRETDTFARLGGDEFVLLFPNTSKTDLEDSCNQIINLLAHKNNNQMNIDIQCSIGATYIYYDE
jgi:diguanylate cyclase (GGDEF)-like protein